MQKPRNQRLHEILKGRKGGPMEDKKAKLTRKEANRQVREFIRDLRIAREMLDT